MKNLQIYRIDFADGTQAGYFTLSGARSALRDAANLNNTFDGQARGVKPCILSRVGAMTEQQAQSLACEQTSVTMRGGTTRWDTGTKTAAWAKRRKIIIERFRRMIGVTEAELAAMIMEPTDDEIARRREKAAASAARRSPAKMEKITQYLAERGITRDGGNKSWWGNQVYSAARALGL